MDPSDASPGVQCFVEVRDIANPDGNTEVVSKEQPLRRSATSRGHRSSSKSKAPCNRLRPKLMTVCVVLASLIPILWKTGVGADVMKPIAAPIVGGMITSTIHVFILVPVFFALMKERALRRGTLQPQQEAQE